MAARPRKRKGKGLEPNLYERRGYFTYRNPVEGTWHGMGRDRAKAQDAARILNARLMQGADYVARVMGEEGITLGYAIDAWLKERVDDHPKHSVSTKKNKHYRSGRIKRDRGETLLSQIDVKWCAMYLDENFKGDPYVQYRAVLSQIFNFAQTKGWIDDNPVAPTRKSDESYTVKRKRLTVDQFKAIHAQAEPWFQVAMELALLCLFGRAEVSSARYDHIEGGTLHYIRQKTRERSKSAYVAIGLTPAIEDLIGRSRLLPPVSPFIVHRAPDRGRRPGKSKTHWSQVTPDMLSRTFAKHRANVPSIAALPDAAQPTFHEIRSLGSRLLELKGVEVGDIQVLMGHAEEEMTQHYLDGHGTRWQQAKGNPFSMADLLAQN
ncbi:phage integrase Arm DNA-binding domain-containing protein [Chromohalobacter sp. 48-RD10]|uniref:phage integrase Arm DNA-binding domain-containing protein n=1 Tax=Chromohalobacter sp. 48-RD10 TaxID=2994063 RepID=UPI00246833B1|nr:phage integrase Arm DNA-binding domain-containing protein [Chromohalobacter sp. 48-RD10]